MISTLGVRPGIRGDTMRSGMAPTVNPTVLALLKEMRGVLEARFGPRLREIVLFGSHARGEAHEDSDVDVLVVIDDLSEPERRAVFDLAYDVARPLPELVVINPLAYSTAQAIELRGRQRLLFRDIDREGLAL